MQKRRAMIGTPGVRAFLLENLFHFFGLILKSSNFILILKSKIEIFAAFLFAHFCFEIAMLCLVRTIFATCF